MPSSTPETPFSLVVTGAYKIHVNEGEGLKGTRGIQPGQEARYEGAEAAQFSTYCLKQS